MKTHRDVVIIDGVRTPFAKAGTRLKDIHPVDLGRLALTELVAKTQLDVNEVDEVIVGNAGSPTDAVNLSRVIALRSGLPLKTSAYNGPPETALPLWRVSLRDMKNKVGDHGCGRGWWNREYVPNAAFIH